MVFSALKQIFFLDHLILSVEERASTLSSQSLSRAFVLTARRMRLTRIWMTRLAFLSSSHSSSQGMGNIFAIEPKQLYTESPTSDKYAKTGLGGIVGVVLTLGILAGVFIGVKTLGSFEASNNEFVGYAGESVSHYAQKFSYTTSATTTDESTPPVVASADDSSEAPPSIAENFN